MFPRQMCLAAADWQARDWAIVFANTWELDGIVPAGTVNKKRDPSEQVKEHVCDRLKKIVGVPGPPCPGPPVIGPFGRIVGPPPLPPPSLAQM